MYGNMYGRIWDVCTGENLVINLNVYMLIYEGSFQIRILFRSSVLKTHTQTHTHTPHQLLSHGTPLALGYSHTLQKTRGGLCLRAAMCRLLVKGSTLQNVATVLTSGCTCQPDVPNGMLGNYSGILRTAYKTYPA